MCLSRTNSARCVEWRSVPTGNQRTINNQSGLANQRTPVKQSGQLNSRHKHTSKTESIFLFLLVSSSHICDDCLFYEGVCLFLLVSLSYICDSLFYEGVCLFLLVSLSYICDSLFYEGVCLFFVFSFSPVRLLWLIGLNVS